MTKKSTERQTAIEQGLKTYEGKPCVRCGTTTKYVSQSSCVSCTAQSTKQRDPEIFHKYIKSDKGQEWLKSYRKTKIYRDVQNQWLNDSGYGRMKTAVRRKYVREQLDLLNEQELNNIIDIYKLAAQLTKVTGKQYDVDHIVRLADGGRHHPDNLQVLLREDHILKSIEENKRKI